MKKILVFIMCLILPCFVFAETKELNIYLFKGSTCPHCRDLSSFLNEYLSDKDNIVLNEYEVWNDLDNAEMFNGVKEITKDYSTGVPYLIIGNKVIIGYSSAKQEEIINYINYYQNNYFEDEVGKYISEYKNSINNAETLEENESNSNEDIVNYSTLPYNIKKIINNNSNFISSIILGLISSFNISFVFIVLIFICILLLYKDNHYKIIIGITFIFSYIITNFIYVSGMFNNEILLDKTSYIRIILSSLLMIYGVYKILRFLNKKEESNKVIVSIFLFIVFTMINILSIYSNIDVPSIFNQVIINNKILYSIIYSLFGVILFSLIFILCIELFKLKIFKNKYKYFYIVSSIIIIVLSCIIVSNPFILI